MTKPIPLDTPLHLRPVHNGGWVISVGEDPRMHPEMFAFTSAVDMMKALLEAFSIDPITDEVSDQIGDWIVRADEANAKLDQVAHILGAKSDAEPRGRYLRDLHLEPGDVVMAESDDFPLGVHLGSSYRVGRHPTLGFVIHLPMAMVDRDYQGARFVVVHRAPQKVAL